MSFVFKFKSEKTHVFIHIPKNGGTTLWQTLSEYNPYRDTKKRRPDERFIGHLTYRETRVLFCGEEKLSFFCITRNPWARMVSFFNYLKQTHPKKHGYHELHKRLKKKMRFDDFVIHITQDEQIKYQSQWQYMIDKSGNLAVDDILTLEDFQSDLNLLLEKNDCVKLHVDRHNASEHAHYSEYYNSSSTVQLVSQYEKDIVKLKNYKFEH
jgi:hypothetical protein